MKLPNMYHVGRLKFLPSNTWYTEHVHGPNVWPWWKLVVIRVVKCSRSGIRFNHNVWFYTRWGAWVCQVAYDTRNFPK